jgi:hypothetical protein
MNLRFQYQDSLPWQSPVQVVFVADWVAFIPVLALMITVAGVV